MSDIKENELWTVISELATEIFNKDLPKGKNMETQTQPQLQTASVTARYTTPDQYKEQTGKRFRMTRDQKQRNLTREQAFAEFLTVSTKA